MPVSGSSFLIIDDDAATREILGDRLKFLGYRVLTAADGQTGLALLDHADLQLVLLA